MPETENEINTIGSLKIFNNSTKLLGLNATEENVLKSDLIAKSDVISFATHGYAFGELNTFSEPGLILTVGDKSSKDNNGFLSISEIANLNLNADLVILSACNTGAPLSSFSSPFSGLASSFLAAGTNQVLASHWEIDDKSTSYLMTSIIEKKQNDLSWSSVHRLGVIDFIDKYPEYTPYYWAPFILFGSELN